MEVDTGAAVSVISEETRTCLFSNIKVNDTSVILTTYTGEQMAVTGEVSVTVTYRQKNHLLTLCVIKVCRWSKLPGKGSALPIKSRHTYKVMENHSSLPSVSRQHISEGSPVG